MTQSGNFKFHTPIFRVNNRQENIDFYQNTLGFKLLTEENALAVFTDWADRNSLFVIEESPAYRCRAVKGPKKINKVVIKVSDPLEIEYLLARDDHQAKAIFQGEKGYGFKLLTEENALAVFTDWADRNSLFVIEESPAYRCRAVKGPKKINKVVIKVSDPLEIEYLLARDDHQAKAIFQGEKGYAFETISPENGLILMHAEDDLSTLKTVEYADVEEKEDFKGVSDFTVESLTLNVVDTAQAAFFYDNLFGEELPLSIHFEKAEGPDLQVSPDQTWDLEILEFKVAEDYDLVALHEKLEKEQFSSYLDTKESLLALTDMSNIEVWLTK